MIDYYFDTIDTGALCRGGGNGPFHPSQFRGLSLVSKGESLLDVGCGSGTTAECILKHFKDRDIKYKGIDQVKRHIDWCKKEWPELDFEVQEAKKLKEPDNSWDVVWSRHVVDHVSSFEKTIDEHFRVAKKKVICILWYPFSDTNKHSIKHVKYGEKTYKNEFLNQYSLSKVLWFLKSKYPEWRLSCFFNIALAMNKQGDTLFYLEKNED